MKQSRIYTKELLQEVVNRSLNFTDLCRNLGKFPAGGTYQLIKNRVKDYEIDTSHFLGYKTLCGYKNKSIIPLDPDKVLVEGYKYRAKSKNLRKCLLKKGIKYCCEICKLISWEGKEITLQVDHKNGNWSDCRLENLRFLCPNCHTQTSTYGKKNKNTNLI